MVSVLVKAVQLTAQKGSQPIMSASSPLTSGAERQVNHARLPGNLPMSQEAIEAIPFPLTIYAYDGLLVGANALIEQLFQVPRSVTVGNFNLLTDQIAQHESPHALFQAALKGERVQAPPVAYNFSFPGTHTTERTSCWIETTYFPFSDAAGTVTHVGLIIQDVSDRVFVEQAQQQREAERVALQEQVIAAQGAALRELSTPLIPISDEVVAMPLIGSIDSARAQLVLETLLTGVAERQASTTIIDITGVSVVDTQVADALIRAAQAVKLLGARVILTGIRPEVAQTLVNLGVDLSGIVTRGTLQSGIAEALGRQGERLTLGRR
jgi:anti-anti-sigma regulatory factor